MPSQQMNLTNFSNTSEIPRSLTGPNILHKHSINSLLEQQDLISRGLTPPTECENMSISDILGLSGNALNLFSSSANNQQVGTTSPTTGLPYTPNSTNSSISPGVYNNNSSTPGKSFDAFQFENIGQSTPLKLFRNLSCDSSTPMSPTTPSSLYPRSIKGSPKFRDSNSPLTPENPFLYGLSSGSNSPDSDYNAFSNMDNKLVELMNYLTINNQQQQQPQQQQQQQQPQQQYNRLSQNDLQNLQALNAFKLLQQQSQQKQNLPNFALGWNQLFQNCGVSDQTKNNWQSNNNNPSTPTHPTTNNNNNHNNNNNNNFEGSLDRIAKYHRSSAAQSDATSTWSGILPQRSVGNKATSYSNKVFLGGIPPDITEQMFADIFKDFGPIRVEWPTGKENHSSKPKGYAYMIFESEKQVRAVLANCSVQVGNPATSRKYFYKISTKYLKPQKIEVIPWIIADSNYSKSTSQKLEPGKTVFVGALHGQLTAEGLAKIMDELFEGVVYAGIDTDKHKYPLGSARVTFNNCHSYLKAVSAAFIDVRSSKFKRKIFQIDPYLEDALCSYCGVTHGPYFCRELSCFRYYCRNCWQWQHSCEPMLYHKPMTKNSKSQKLIGIGPQQQQQQSHFPQQYNSNNNNCSTPPNSNLFNNGYNPQSPNYNQSTCLV